MISITSTTLDVHSIFTLLSTMDWYLEVRIRAEDKQYSSCPLIQETKIMNILNILTSLYHVERDTCTMHGKTSRRGILGWYWSWNQRRIKILSDTIECNYPSRNTSSLLYSKSCEIEDWRSFVWKIIRISLDHHQRSHYDTITIGPEGLTNWVLQLNNSQSVNSFNSLVEKFNTKRSPN